MTSSALPSRKSRDSLSTVPKTINKTDAQKAMSGPSKGPSKVPKLVPVSSIVDPNRVLLAELLEILGAQVKEGEGAADVIKRLVRERDTASALVETAALVQASSGGPNFWAASPVATGTAVPDVSMSTPTNVPLGSVFTDERGSIENIFSTELPIGSVVRITTKKDSRRANHFHKETGWHFCTVVSGHIEYYERPVGSTEAPKKFDFFAGHTFFTPPQVEHLMCFPDDTTFWCFSGNERSHEAYEADLVRLAEPLA
jgi:quercetin dioxygenase-like cupin family protein